MGMYTLSEARSTKPKKLHEIMGVWALGLVRTLCKDVVAMYRMTKSIKRAAQRPD